jgi:hypothetical protein
MRAAVEHLQPQGRKEDDEARVHGCAHLRDVTPLMYSVPHPGDHADHHRGGHRQRLDLGARYHTYGSNSVAREHPHGMQHQHADQHGGHHLDVVPGETAKRHSLTGRRGFPPGRARRLRPCLGIEGGRGISHQSCKNLDSTVRVLSLTRTLLFNKRTRLVCSRAQSHDLDSFSARHASNAAPRRPASPANCPIEIAGACRQARPA